MCPSIFPLEERLDTHPIIIESPHLDHSEMCINYGFVGTILFHHYYSIMTAFVFTNDTPKVFSL